MSRLVEIRTRLEAAFEVEALEIIDDSESHRGHAGFQEGGESHIRIVMCAPEFAGMSRIAQHRAVFAAMGADMVEAVHAIGLELSSA